MIYRRIYWDLDGTLTDPQEGVTRCVQYALDRMGVAVDPDSLESFIGPPLQASFRRHYGFRDAVLDCAITFYRERFEAVGFSENVAIPGIQELLSDLERRGVWMAVATSKPTPYAERILGTFGLRDHFQAVFGNQLTGTPLDKPAILAQALEGLASEDRREAAMIGDHPDDVRAANICGLSAVAVTYGYGDQTDLERLEPQFIAHDVNALRAWLLTP